MFGYSGTIPPQGVNHRGVSSYPFVRVRVPPLDRPPLQSIRLVLTNSNRVITGKVLYVKNGYHFE